MHKRVPKRYRGRTTQLKIDGVKITSISLPRRRRHRWATSNTEIGHRYVLMKLETDRGIVGLGEAECLPEWGGDHMRYFGETATTVAHVIRDYLFPAVQDCDPLRFELLHERMDKAIKGYPYAKACMDMALLDVAGKLHGVPVYALLGGLYRDRIPIAHSLGIMEDQQAIQEAQQAVSEGIRTIKVKVGLDPERDMRIIEKLRAALGPDIALVADANQGYRTPKIAIEVIRSMEKSNLRYMEQPVEGLAEMARVTRSVSAHVMADESAWTGRDVVDIARLGAADMISIYTTKPGGISRARKVADVAEAHGLPCNVNGSGEMGVGNAANLHLVASAANISEACVIPITAIAGKHVVSVAGMFYEDDIITAPFEYEDGHLVVPDGPGLGVTLDDDKIALYSEEVN